MKDTIQVRINDLNFGAHMGHVEFVHLLHEMRVRFLKHKGMDELNVNGYALVMRHLEVDYLRQAFLHDELEMDVRVHIDKARIVFCYEVQNLTQSNRLGTARAEMVLVDKATLRPVKPALAVGLYNPELI